MQSNSPGITLNKNNISKTEKLNPASSFILGPNNEAIYSLPKKLPLKPSRKGNVKQIPIKVPPRRKKSRKFITDVDSSEISNSTNVSNKDVNSKYLSMVFCKDKLESNCYVYKQHSSNVDYSKPVLPKKNEKEYISNCYPNTKSSMSKLDILKLHWHKSNSQSNVTNHIYNMDHAFQIEPDLDSGVVSNVCSAESLKFEQEEDSFYSSFSSQNTSSYETIFLDDESELENNKNYSSSTSRYSLNSLAKQCDSLINEMEFQKNSTVCSNYDVDFDKLINILNECDKSIDVFGKTDINYENKFCVNCTENSLPTNENFIDSEINKCCLKTNLNRELASINLNKIENDKVNALSFPKDISSENVLDYNPTWQVSKLWQIEQKESMSIDSDLLVAADKCECVMSDNKKSDLEYSIKDISDLTSKDFIEKQKSSTFKNSLLYMEFPYINNDDFDGTSMKSGSGIYKAIDKFETIEKTTNSIFLNEILKMEGDLDISQKFVEKNSEKLLNLESKKEQLAKEQFNSSNIYSLESQEVEQKNFNNFCSNYLNQPNIQMENKFASSDVKFTLRNFEYPINSEKFSPHLDIKEKKINPMKPFLVNLSIEGQYIHLGPLEFQVFFYMTLAMLKMKISNKMGIKTSHQRWILGNRFADNDDSTLLSYGVLPGSYIFLYVDLNFRELNSNPFNLIDNYLGPNKPDDIESLNRDLLINSASFDSKVQTRGHAIKFSNHLNDRVNVKNMKKAVISKDVLVSLKSKTKFKSRILDSETKTILKTKALDNYYGNSNNDNLHQFSSVSSSHQVLPFEKINMDILTTKDCAHSSNTNNDILEEPVCTVNLAKSLEESSNISEKCNKIYKKVDPLENAELKFIEPFLNENFEELENPCEKDDLKSDLKKDYVNEIEKNYENFLKLENLELVPNADPFECPICFCLILQSEGVVLKDCLHTFCRDCLTSVISYASESSIKCPYRDDLYFCDAVLQAREIKALVSADIYERHLQRSLITAESVAEKSFHCKSVNCSGWCVVEDNVNIFHCPVCFHYNCLTCQAIHEGLNCRQYQDNLKQKALIDKDAEQTLQLLSKMVKEGQAMKCPKCLIVLMKKWGCDWLKCSVCQTEVCWITKGPRWGPEGRGDTSAGCKCGVNGKKCHPSCTYCH